ncbi:MAG: hypothetical protein WB506_08710, partial [Candidatus Sulfotelmatobacter sp.]
MENRLRSVGEEDIPGKPPLFTPIGGFLFFGAAMASLAGITLIWRGTQPARLAATCTFWQAGRNFLPGAGHGPSADWSGLVSPPALGMEIVRRHYRNSG